MKARLASFLRYIFALGVVSAFLLSALVIFQKSILEFLFRCQPVVEPFPDSFLAQNLSSLCRLKASLILPGYVHGHTLTPDLLMLTVWGLSIGMLVYVLFSVFFRVSANRSFLLAALSSSPFLAFAVIGLVLSTPAGALHPHLIGGPLEKLLPKIEIVPGPGCGRIKEVLDPAGVACEKITTRIASPVNKGNEPRRRNIFIKDGKFSMPSQEEIEEYMHEMQSRGLIPMLPDQLLTKPYTSIEGDPNEAASKETK